MVGRGLWSDELDDVLDGRPEDIEVDTVDGFHGREKEVVVVSLVRSNDRGEIGLLEDPRRFDVALTRARRKAIVVGDAETVTTAMCSRTSWRTCGSGARS